MADIDLDDAIETAENLGIDKELKINDKEWFADFLLGVACGIAALRIVG
jgi:hypothetical protein